MKTIQAMAVSLFALCLPAASFAVDFRAGIMAGFMEAEGDGKIEEVSCPSGVSCSVAAAGANDTTVDLYAPGASLSLSFSGGGVEYGILADARYLDGSDHSVIAAAYEDSSTGRTAGAGNLIKIDPKWSANLLAYMGYNSGYMTPYIAAGGSVIEVDTSEASVIVGVVIHPSGSTSIESTGVTPRELGVEFEGETVYGYKAAAGVHFDFGEHRISAELGYAEYEDDSLFHDFTVKGFSLRYMIMF